MPPSRFEFQVYHWQCICPLSAYRCPLTVGWYSRTRSWTSDYQTSEDEGTPATHKHPLNPVNLLNLMNPHTEGASKGKKQK